jgi:hypothetical protein
MGVGIDEFERLAGHVPSPDIEPGSNTAGRDDSRQSARQVNIWI